LDQGCQDHKEMKNIKKIFALTILLISFFEANSQIRSGVIQYERRINLLKRYPEMKMMLERRGGSTIKTDLFSLYFTDTSTFFVPALDVPQERGMGWFTTTNSYQENLKTQQRLMKLDFLGNFLYVEDSIKSIPWKFTDNKRKIAGYNCRKAVWQKNDSTRIYAWYTEAIYPTCGPDGISGLPGAILGLATEDGSLVYFAQSIESKEINLDNLTPLFKRKKALSYIEFKQTVNDMISQNDRLKGLLRNLLWY
jgi:GLPGLI family protein